MDYRAFADAVEEQMNQKMTGGVKVSLHTATKNNGKERTGILIESPGVNISPTIYLEEYFKNFQQGVKLEAIVEEMLELYEDIRQEKSWDYEKILCYERIRLYLSLLILRRIENFWIQFHIFRFWICRRCFMCCWK